MVRRRLVCGLKYLSILEDERKLLEFEILMSYALQGDKEDIADKINEYRRDERTRIGASGEAAVEASYQEHVQW